METAAGNDFVRHSQNKNCIKLYRTSLHAVMNNSCYWSYFQMYHTTDISFAEIKHFRGNRDPPTPRPPVGVLRPPAGVNGWLTLQQPLH